MDILQQLPLDDWIKLKECLRRDWPKYLCHYMWVNNAIKWKTKDSEVKIEIYCPDGKIESGVFVGTANYAMAFAIGFAFDESIDLLRKALMETKIINWSNRIIFSPNFEDFFEEFFKIKNIEVKNKCVANYRFKSKEDCLGDEILIPENYELRKLNNTHTNLIHSLWPHNNFEGSFSFVETVLKLNGGIGLFSKIDNSLVSWIAQTDYSGLGLLQTIDEHKRKGFAKLMVKAISKSIAEEQNLDSIAFVVDSNDSSRKLFDCLGYECKAKVAWYIL